MSGATTSPSSPTDDISGAPRSRRARAYGAGALAAVAVVLLVVGLGSGIALDRYVLNPGGSSAKSVTISETGSSLIAPLFSLWGPNYTAANPDVTITSAATGSGTGISSAESGTVDIGGTDAYLDAANASTYHLINVAAAISAQLIFYNLPGVTAHLNLNGTVIAEIYAGKITTWNDPLIAAANPGVALPAQKIVPLHCSDGSGDTFMFTSLCYLSWKGWTFGYGTTVAWIPSSPGFKGNSGMVTGLSTTKYGIAYIGISYLSEATAAGEQYAAVGDAAANTNGTNPANYILPTPQTIGEDAQLALVNLKPPSVAVSLILGGVPSATDLTLGGGGTMPTATYPSPYPIVNLEYLLISNHPSNPAHQKAVVQFLEWALSTGNAATYLDAVHFLPLTPAVVGYDMQALATVPVSS
jgi:phosphate transport system substrate-binding protein